jgi:hypothetical protein
MRVHASPHKQASKALRFALRIPDSMLARARLKNLKNLEVRAFYFEVQYEV